MKRIDSIEQALQQAEKLQFVMVTEPCCYWQNADGYQLG